MSLTAFITEHEKRLNRLDLYTDVDIAITYIRATFTDRVSAITPELGVKIRHYPYAAALAEAKSWAASAVTRDHAAKPIVCREALQVKPEPTLSPELERGRRRERRGGGRAPMQSTAIEAGGAKSA